MKLNRLLIAALLFAFAACEELEPAPEVGEFETGILIMNEGAFGSNDGEVFHYNQRLEILQSNIFETVNTRPFAGLLEDIVLEQDRLYLVANTGKVEIVNPGNFQSLGAVIGDLDLPRSIATNGDKLFISDYGPFDASFNTPDSYIAVVQGLEGGTVKRKIPISRKPEDLLSVGSLVFVAGSEESKLQIIDADSEELVESISVEGNPIQFVSVNQAPWLFSIGPDAVYFHEINTGNLSIQSTISFPIAQATGRITRGNGTEFYLITSSGFPDYVDGVSRVDLANGNLQRDWVNGSGFYGIGFDGINSQVYLANAKGFQGNGDVLIYDASGALQQTLTVGRAPSGFYFY